MKKCKWCNGTGTIRAIKSLTAKHRNRKRCFYVDRDNKLEKCSHCGGTGFKIK